MSVQRDFLINSSPRAAPLDHSILGMIWHQEPKTTTPNSAHCLLPDGKQNNQVSESEHILIRFFKMTVGLWYFLQINNSSYNFTSSGYDNSKTRVVPIIFPD